MEKKDIYTVNDIARLAGVSRQAINKRIDKFRIKPRLVGNVKVVSAVDANRLVYEARDRG